MANEKNLIRLSSSEARDYGRRGGKASGAARRRKADFRKTLNMLLTAEIDSEEWKPVLESLGVECTLESALLMAQIKEALAGDTNAATFVAKYSGQSPEPEENRRNRDADTELKKARKQAVTGENEADEALNKLDSILKEMHDKLGANPVPLFIPVGKENDFSGVIDLIKEKYITFGKDDQGMTISENEVPENMKGKLSEWKEKLIDSVSSYSDEIMELYFNGEEIPRDLIIATLRKCTLERTLLPVFVGSSLKNIGVQTLLDGIVELLPSPLSVPPVEAKDKRNGKDVLIEHSTKASLEALIFKIQVDPQAGAYCFVRVYSGVLKKGVAVYNITKGKKERVNRLLRMHADRSEELTELRAGDIGVIVGFKNAQTGDTIGVETTPYLLEEMHFPNPVISIAIEARTTEDQGKLRKALETLAMEDPTFTYKDDLETGQLVISGMGELHLDVLVTRITKEMKIDARVGNPQVTYRESIRKESTGTGIFDKTIANKENYAKVTLRLSRLSEGSGNEYKVSAHTRDIPEEILSAISEGVEGSFKSGIKFGYECTAISADVTDIDYDEERASTVAFASAASAAFDQAANAADPVLMEPVMNVQVSAPSEYIGEVMGSITQREGIVESMESRPNGDVVNAKVPLGRMFGYTTILRSSTQGRGTFSMEFSHYDEKK